MPKSPMIEITFCRLCGWGLRAGWMAQELLATFAEELGSVALIPDKQGGVFEVRLDGELLWSRKERGRSRRSKRSSSLFAAASRLRARSAIPIAFERRVSRLRIAATFGASSRGKSKTKGH